ncbi:hypothetical protein ACOMHN_050414 [Nucella lapillus]
MYMGGGGEEGRGEEEENNNERKLIRRPPPTDTDKWNALPKVPSRTEVGYLHLSFEYHKGALRVRVWQISDLLLPPPQMSMIHSIFVRGYFLPDKAKKTQRRTEEVVVEIPEKNGVDVGASSGIQHIFTPSSFKFTTPLLYTGMTGAIVKERSLQLEVCLTQKHTHKVYLTAMVHMPLRTALRRPIREKYPLIPCLNLTTPNNMRVYSATFLPHLTGDPSLSSGSKGGHSEEAELEDDAISLTGEDFLRSHLSLCLDGDSDDDGGSAKPGNDDRMTSSQASSGLGSGTSSSSSDTLNNASSEDEDDDDQCDGTYDGEAVIPDDLEVIAKSTPLSGSPCDASKDLAASKKKIIPNELMPEGCSDTHQNEIGAADRIPDSPVKDSPVPDSNATDSPILSNSESSDRKLQSAGTKTSPDLNTSLSPNALPRKIVPAVNLGIRKSSTDDEEESTQRNVSLDTPRASDDEDDESTQRNDEAKDDAPSSEALGDGSSAEDNEDVVVIEDDSKNSLPQQNKLRADSESTSYPKSSPSPMTDSGFIPTSSPENAVVIEDELKNSSPKPTKPRAGSESNHQGSSHSPQLTKPRADSNGLPKSSLSPMTDSGFCPASRPETPCWDFYDFSEDLQPEGADQESLNGCLEDSLTQLRQAGMGSLQNVSMEPILPMVLVDDFDTLTADDEH